MTRATCFIIKSFIVFLSLTGIGYWTAHDFATRNAKVILACRSQERAEEAREKIIAATGNQKVVVRLLNLSDFESVRRFAEQTLQEEDRLDILVNNAAIACMKYSMCVCVCVCVCVYSVIDSRTCIVLMSRISIKDYNLFYVNCN